MENMWVWTHHLNSKSSGIEYMEFSPGLCTYKDPHIGRQYWTLSRVCPSSREAIQLLDHGAQLMLIIKPNCCRKALPRSSTRSARPCPTFSSSWPSWPSASARSWDRRCRENWRWLSWRRSSWPTYRCPWSTLQASVFHSWDQIIFHFDLTQR